MSASHHASQGGIRLLSGGLASDDRGVLRFVNGFDLLEYRRFYLVENHQPSFVRAWHAHKLEAKAVTVVRGAAVVAAVRIDDWDNPSRDLEVMRVVLAAQSPTVMEIPPGYANGFMTLQADTQMMFFSSSTLEESLGDDFRFPARHWDVWGVEER